MKTPFLFGLSCSNVRRFSDCKRFAPRLELLESRDTPSTVIINDSTPAYWSGNLGDLFGIPAEQSNIPEPPQRDDPSLGTWLGVAAPSAGTWTASPVAVPQGISDEDALVYVIDAGPNGLQNVQMSFGADNGIFVWLDGIYKFGDIKEGGYWVGEYTLNLGNLSPGKHYLQLLREDHGGGAMSSIEVYYDTSPFTYFAPHGSAPFSMFLGRSGGDIVLRNGAGKVLARQSESLTNSILIYGNHGRMDILTVDLASLGGTPLPYVFFVDDGKAELRLLGKPDLQARYGSVLGYTGFTSGGHNFVFNSTKDAVTSVANFGSLKVTTGVGGSATKLEALKNGSLKISDSGMSAPIVANNISSITIDSVSLDSNSDNIDTVTYSGKTPLSSVKNIAVETGDGNDQLILNNAPRFRTTGSYFYFYGGLDIDTIKSPRVDNEWNLTGTFSGSLSGGGGKSYFVGVERLIGNADKDLFIVQTLSENYFLEGGLGINSISYFYYATGVTVDLTKRSATAVNYGADNSIQNIQNVYGSMFDDWITGDQTPNKIYGNRGRDVILGNSDLGSGEYQAVIATNRGGKDEYYGGEGDDQIRSDSRDDIIDGGLGTDTVTVQAGHKSLKAEIISLWIDPSQPQNNNWSCGPNSGSRLLRSLGTNVSYSQMMATVQENSQLARFELGTLPSILLRSLQRWKPKAQLEIDTSFSRVISLLKSGKPVIVLHASDEVSLGIGGTYGLLHYVVLTGYDPIAKTIDFCDTNGGFGYWSYTEFQRRWNWTNFFQGALGKPMQAGLWALGLRENTILY